MIASNPSSSDAMRSHGLISVAPLVPTVRQKRSRGGGASSKSNLNKQFNNQTSRNIVNLGMGVTMTEFEQQIMNQDPNQGGGNYHGACHTFNHNRPIVEDKLNRGAYSPYAQFQSSSVSPFTIQGGGHQRSGLSPFEHVNKSENGGIFNEFAIDRQLCFESELSNGTYYGISHNSSSEGNDSGIILNSSPNEHGSNIPGDLTVIAEAYHALSDQFGHNSAVDGSSSTSDCLNMIQPISGIHSTNYISSASMNDAYRAYAARQQMKSEQF